MVFLIHIDTPQTSTDVHRRPQRYFPRLRKHLQTSGDVHLRRYILSLTSTGVRLLMHVHRCMSYDVHLQMYAGVCRCLQMYNRRRTSCDVRRQASKTVTTVWQPVKRRCTTTHRLLLGLKVAVAGCE